MLARQSCVRLLLADHLLGPFDLLETMFPYEGGLRSTLFNNNKGKYMKHKVEPVDPLTLTPYIELWVDKNLNSEIVSFKSMWLRLHRKSSVGRYDEIKVCPTWVSFKAFLADMGPKPNPKYSIDRIDCRGHYCKDNCRWADDHTQRRNKSNSIKITDGTRVWILKDLCKELGINYQNVWSRITANWDLNEALLTPVGKIGTNFNNQPRASGSKYLYSE